MNLLDPSELFERLARELPDEVSGHVVVVGSLAAAFHYRTQLSQSGVRTKDADLALIPRAQAVAMGEAAAKTLRGAGWTPTLDFGGPRSDAEPTNQLPAIRLNPPGSHDYFVEFLTVPSGDQAMAREWLPVELSDGWWGIPSLRFLGVATAHPFRSASGLQYARPAGMALANLLSHPTIGPEVMQQPYGGRPIKRSNKDLGRVLSLARLEGEGYADWPQQWARSLEVAFPATSDTLRTNSGAGIRALLASENDLDEAWHTCVVGLLGRSSRLQK